MSHTFSTAGARDLPRGSFRLPFTDLPRVELDALLDELSARAQDVRVTLGRLRHLLHAHAAVTSEVSLQTVLQHIVTAARELVEARHAALGVIDEHGEFFHVGVDEDTVEGIRDLPHGRGIPGLLVTHPGPVRLTDLTAAGFPAHHPDMDSFLGVPIRVRDRVFGGLHLTGSANGRFSTEDEQLAIALAASAGVALDDARLHQESEQRHRWLTASAEVTRKLFAQQDEHPLDMVLKAAQQAADADFAVLELLTAPAQLQVEATSGVLTDEMLASMDSSVAAQVVCSGTPTLVAAPADTESVGAQARIGSVIVVPLPAGDHTTGTLSVGRLTGRPSFTGAAMNHLADFGAHAAIAMDLNRVHADQQVQRISDDHDRIGLALNNHVIQRLFAVSLGLQGLLATDKNPSFRHRVNGYIDILDTTISHIRADVYNVDVTPGSHTRSLQNQVLTAVDDHTTSAGFPATVTFRGRFGRAIPSALADDVVDAVRDALTSIAGHTDTTRAELRVDIAGDLIAVACVDGRTQSSTWTARIPSDEQLVPASDR
ncbi:GAF domain-containing protein [Lentzea sp. BCCO 10_0798]|uniref:GAF domain-containing protein n=1 Tax=Lentzea kristufekii TaxID=3095430 RepID=A0ABU4TQJ4_9PSEU|nr:GAF domain-containing protein [Lentzea sp. BCCO 10_0798]MDX8050556.1 GAF domain-containing protein [Lentzea sp. BCCO 10_0798]